MHCLNDICKVEVSADEYGFGGDQGKTESGILVELPLNPPYFGYHSFAFEASYNNAENQVIMDEYYGKLLGKRVYWTGLSERGMVFKEGEKTYAFIKLTDLIAYSKPDVEATLILSGEFRA